MTTITMRNLHLATEQQVFDQVAKHLLTQNAKALAWSGGCQYRLLLDDGTVLKCAVGCLIADNEYGSKIEGELYGSNEFNEFFGFKDEVPHFFLLRRFQSLHDSYDVSTWKERLEQIALDFNLNTDILEEFN